jgi:hypothetical protein
LSSSVALAPRKTNLNHCFCQVNNYLTKQKTDKTKRMVTGTYANNVSAPLFGVVAFVEATPVDAFVAYPGLLVVDDTFKLLEPALVDATVASSGHCGEGLPAKQMNDQ